MTRSLILATLLTVSLCVNMALAITTEQQQAICSSVGDLAYQLASFRDEGMPLIEALATTPHLQGSTSDITNLLRSTNDQAILFVYSNPSMTPDAVRAHFLAGCLSYSISEGKEKSKGDREKIRGTWRMVSLEVNGEKAPQELIKTITYTFTKDKYMVKLGDKITTAGTYRLDPTKRPKWMEVTYEKTAEISIYELEGNILKICTSEQNSKDRPVEFATKPNSKQSLFVLKREKP